MCSKKNYSNVFFLKFALPFYGLLVFFLLSLSAAMLEKHWNDCISRSSGPKDQFLFVTREKPKMVEVYSRRLHFVPLSKRHSLGLIYDVSNENSKRKPQQICRGAHTFLTICCYVSLSKLTASHSVSIVLYLFFQ